MSSESDNEVEFYDALEITPARLAMSEEIKSNEHGSIKSSASPISSKIPRITKQTETQQSPNSPKSSSFDPEQKTQSAQSLLQSLETTSFSKEKSVEMPPPADPPPSVGKLSLDAAARQKDYEESSSACSGSLLGNLGDDDEEIPKERLNRFRHRHKEVQRKMNKDDDSKGQTNHSPVGSQSSSLDGVYPSMTSHPFRVVEMDSASVYSSISLGKIGKILSNVENVAISEDLVSKNIQIHVEENEDISHLSQQIIPNQQNINTAEFVGQSLCPEPDLVASTRSSSGSDKSNSLPRSEQDTVSAVISTSSSSTIAASSPSCSLSSTSISTIVPQHSSFSDISNPEQDHINPSNKITDTIMVNQDVESSENSLNSNLISTLSSTKITNSMVTSRSIPSSVSSSPTERPIAPPRKKRRAKPVNGGNDDTVSIASISSLPMSHINANADKISIGHSLDLRAAVRGDYLVKPQDSEYAKALGLSPEQVAEAEAMSTSEATSLASTPEISRSLIKDNADHPSESRSGSLKKSNSSIEARGSFTVTNNSQSASNSGTLESVKNKNVSSEATKQLNMAIRTRSDSGKELSDQEILQQISVLNLDTGQRIPLSEAEQALPEALNPLSLHIMRLTSEYVGASTADDNQESDDDSVADIIIQKIPEIDATTVKKKTFQFKKFLGKKMESAVNKAKSLAQEVSNRHKEEKDVFEDDTPAQSTMQYVKIKTSHSHKGPHEFDNLLYVQEITGEQKGPVWCMKFSGCGQLLATAGQDHVLRVWVLKTAFNFFLDIRNKCNADVKVSPTPSQESLVSQHSGQSGEDPGSLDPNDDGNAPFMPKPFCVYSGHQADMLDISWSKNYFILTSSMDKTVRLWHISRKECLCIFQHMDFVTAIAFHPKDDRYFISGSLDGKLRLWSIPDKRVVLWTEVDGQSKLITAANFCQNGLFTAVGTYDGRCIFYETDQLKYHTTIHVRSTRGKNAKGRKITGIEPLPGEDKVLITSNDSRIRLYDLRDLNLSCKYKGYSNVSSQIRAGFSHDGKFIVAGSENQCIYIWKTYHDYSKFSSARRDRNGYWEGVKAHGAVVTCSVFAPHPELVFDFIEKQKSKLTNENTEESKQPTAANAKDGSFTNKGYVLVSADFIGCIKVFLKREKAKHSSLPASALI